MKTQCSHCQMVQDVPDHYQDKPVKCSKCRRRFAAILYFPVVETPGPIPLASCDPLPFSPAPWNSLYIVAVLAILVSLIGAILGSVEWSNSDYPQPFGFFINVMLFGIALTGVLLSCILIALGVILHHLDTLSKNSQKS